jgi:hypothetical protein
MKDPSYTVKLSKSHFFHETIPLKHPALLSLQYSSAQHTVAVANSKLPRKEGRILS